MSDEEIRYRLDKAIAELLGRIYNARPPLNDAEKQALRFLIRDIAREIGITVDIT